MDGEGRGVEGVLLCEERDCNGWSWMNEQHDLGHGRQDRHCFHILLSFC